MIFLKKNADYEFVHYDTEERLKNDHEIGRRTRIYHFLQKYRRRYKINFINEIFTFLERILLLIQIICHVDRLRNSKMKIKYGSQWVSITDDLVQYILKNRKVIYKLFKFSNCADELFIQTLIYNSKYRYRLYDEKFDNSIDANKRLIDWSRGRNGNPYVWTILDKKVIDESECLFARKFDEIIDEEIIKYIISKVK